MSEKWTAEKVQEAIDEIYKNNMYCSAVSEKLSELAEQIHADMAAEIADLTEMLSVSDKQVAAAIFANG